MTIDRSGDGITITRVTDDAGLAGCHLVRRVVFIEEQSVPEDEEWDALDSACTHLLASDADGPVGTLRILPKEDMAKIQRVAIMTRQRGTGLGRRLMQSALDMARADGFRGAVLDAQTYAIPFYGKLGFEAHGPEFDDAGIPHRQMTLIFDRG